MSVADTQAKLSKLISKPKLTEQLLSRPPFRFLHDVISAITQATGFGEGLYADDELNSENIKEKQAKINYLTKIINCVGYALGIQVEAKPAKIVAGLEVEQTNTFLQQLADAAGNKSLDWKGAVAKALNGDAAPAGGEPKEDADAKKKKKKREDEKPAEQEQPPATESEDAKAEERKRREKEKEREREKEKEEKRRKKKEKEGEEQDGAGAAEESARPPSGQAAKQPSSKGLDESQTKGQDAPSEAEPEEKKKPARPMSARMAPPKVGSNVKTVEKKVDQPDRVSDGGPGVSNVILEKAKPEDDDDIILQGPADHQEIFGGKDEDGEGHGKLMRGILESKREAEEAAAREKEEAQAKKEASGGIIIHREKKKESANFEKEIDKLRENLQVLCRSANPLGRAMDYMQEDLESMSKEMEMWKREANNQSQALEEEMKVTENSLTGLQGKYAEIDTQIKERLNKIDTMKAQILKV
eukprot:TRINITY_DN14_c0_g1_i3.p1 TRINITY_DN14_c0_g1~~TRINITY_DN14_c0_g1_i3.p1  ORF type:complete len:472 (-),score=168.42 TRINITY_DN14_c0_g1_i3:616-2031(-)